MKYKKIIFVSNSDTCRAELAAAAFREIGKSYISENNIEVDSKGIVVLFPEPMNPKGVAVAKSRQLDVEGHVSCALTGEDFGTDILVLTMTDSIMRKIYEDYKKAVNVFAIKEFVGEDGDVEAVCGGELPDYGELFRNIERLVNKVYDKLIQ